MVCQRRSYWWLGVLTKHHSKSGICGVPVHIKGFHRCWVCWCTMKVDWNWKKNQLTKLIAKISRGEGEEFLKLLKAVWVGKNDLKIQRPPEFFDPTKPGCFKPSHWSWYRNPSWNHSDPSVATWLYFGRNYRCLKSPGGWFSAPNLQVDDENGGKAMNPMDSVFDLDALRKALLLGKFSREVFLKRVENHSVWCFLYQKKSFKFWGCLFSRILVLYFLWSLKTAGRSVGSAPAAPRPTRPTWWVFFSTRKRRLGVKIQSGKLVCHGCWRPPSPPTARYGWGKGQIIGRQHPWTIDMWSQHPWTRNIWCIYGPASLGTSPPPQKKICKTPFLAHISIKIKWIR